MAKLRSKAKKGEAVEERDEHEVWLAPQAEAPRGFVAQDRSQGRKSGPIELSWSRFDLLVTGLAASVKKSFQPTAVVGVAHGGVFVGGALASALSADFFPVRISRRSRDRVVSKSPKLFGEMPKELAGERVLIVDDVAQSGDTLELACALAEKVGAAEVKTCALVKRDTLYSPDFVALESEDVLVFPWDYDLVAEDDRFVERPQKRKKAEAAPAPAKKR